MINSTPIQYGKYTETMLKFIKNGQPFSHQDIAKITGCNCSYGVIRQLRAKCKLIEAWVRDEKPHKVYIYDGELDE